MDNILSHVFKAILQIWNQVEEINCMFAHKYVDPRSVPIWRLMMLTPGYLTSNQSQQCLQLVMNLQPSPCLKKTFRWKQSAIWAFWALAAWSPCSLPAKTKQKNPALSWMVFVESLYCTGWVDSSFLTKPPTRSIPGPLNSKDTGQKLSFPMALTYVFSWSNSLHTWLLIKWSQS